MSSSAYCHSLYLPVNVCLYVIERQINKVTDAEAMGGDGLQEENGFPDKNSPKHVSMSLRSRSTHCTAKLLQVLITTH